MDCFSGGWWSLNSNINQKIVDSILCNPVVSLLLPECICFEYVSSPKSNYTAYEYIPCDGG